MSFGHTHRSSSQYIQRTYASLFFTNVSFYSPNGTLIYAVPRATAAGDKQVRVFDVGEAAFSGTPNSRETSYNTRQSCTHVLRCHEDRVKRVVTEHSPDLFLTVGEVGSTYEYCPSCRSRFLKDGSVRQHDLRTPHDCRRGPCPAPLVKVNHELSALALSPLTPYQFVVAGESPYVCVLSTLPSLVFNG